MTTDKWGVHIAHCCLLHGCKYGESDYCPVAGGIVEQDYECEQCYEDARALSGLLIIKEAIQNGW